MAKKKKAPRCKKGMKTQTILFSKKQFTVKQARAWLKKNKFKAGKADSTKMYHRFRQMPPGKCRFFRFGKSFKKGVRPVHCCPK